MPTAAAAARTHELLLRLVDRFLGVTLQELDAFVQEHKHVFGSASGCSEQKPLGSGSAGRGSEEKPGRKEEKASRAAPGCHRASSNNEFQKDIDSFLSMPSPAMAADEAEVNIDADADAECKLEITAPSRSAERKLCSKEESASRSNARGGSLDEAGRGRGGAEYSVAQYELYGQYCAQFESSMRCVLCEGEELDTDQLVLMLQKNAPLVASAAGEAEDEQDESIGAIFLELVAALVDFEDFCLMMREAGAGAGGGP
jgi:hypothetical protein